MSACPAAAEMRAPTDDGDASAKAVPPVASFDDVAFDEAEIQKV